MKAHTMLRIAQGIQLLQLDGFNDYTQAQLVNVSGISRKTLQLNADFIKIIEFALNKEGYHQCILHI